MKLHALSQTPCPVSKRRSNSEQELEIKSPLLCSHHPSWKQPQLQNVVLQEIVLPSGTLPKFKVEIPPDIRIRPRKPRDRKKILDSMKSCGEEKDVKKAKLIHVEIRRTECFLEDAYVNTAILSMYMKCGAPTEAQMVFDNLSIRSVVSWNALISGYVGLGYANKALDLFEKMKNEGFLPNEVTFACVLKACGLIRCLRIGEGIFDEVNKLSLLKDNVVLGNAVVDMYAKCGMLEKSREVFEALPVRDVVSWSILITSYVQHGFGCEALNLFKQMQQEGIPPNRVTFTCILKACGSIGSLETGEEIHAEVRKRGLLGEDKALRNTLVDMYAKCGALGKAKEVFEELLVRDVVSWNVLISGYVQHGLGDDALSCFRRMKDEGFSPNAVTFIYILKACSSIGSFEMGDEIHEEINKQRLLETDVVLGTTLVDTYAKCGLLIKAQEVFEKLPVHDVVSWSALIAGYVQYGLWDTALKYFKQMRDEGISPNMVTFLCILKACGKTGSLEMGEEVHKEVNKQRLLKKYGVLGNALVDMYAKCGALGKAQEVFRELSIQDVISWTALISGYTQHGFDEEALKCFEKMRDEGVSPNVVTFICILKACGQIGFLKMGEEIHEQISMKGLFEKYIVLGNTLVDMYAKFGLVEKAQETFDKLPIRDLVSWNALIAGYAQLGQPRRVFNVFGKMRESNTIPDLITFLVVLNACSHAGLVQEGGMVFATMESVYKFNPTLEHYTCMVDLFSRAGHFDKVMSVIEEVPLGDQLPLWLTLLGACYKWVNVHLGRWAFKRSLQLDEKCEASYVCMGNIYAAAGMHAEAEKMEAWRVANDINFWVDRCE